MIWNVEDLLKPEQYIGGDDAGINCPQCNSSDVLIEEYASSNDLIKDESDIGAKCQDCNLELEPDEFEDILNNQE